MHCEYPLFADIDTNAAERLISPATLIPALLSARQRKLAWSQGQSPAA
jgi:hypothetical protein